MRARPGSPSSSRRRPTLWSTALSPRWLAGLLLTVVLAGAFGFLARWQWSRSHEAPPPPPALTETVKPLSSVYLPGHPILQTQADRMVRARGSFDPSKQVLVSGRLQAGDKGYWVVAPFRVAGGESWIPVVRGWTQERRIPDGLPTQATVVGRLLPPEAPKTDDDGSLSDEAISGGGGSEQPSVPTLSPAQLANIWDAPLYDAFIVSREKIPGDAPEDLERVVVGAQPQDNRINWLNVFYAVEWVAFAGFAFFVWFRLVRDDYWRELEEYDGDRA